MSIRYSLGLIPIVVLIMLSAKACGGGDGYHNDYGYGYEGEGYDDYYEIESTITNIIDSRSFLLGDTLITHDSSTRFKYGNADNLAVGRRVEVEGVRTASGTVIAREIEFEYENYYNDYEGEGYDDYYEYDYEGEGYDDYYEIESTITNIIDSRSFLLGDTLITHGSSTRFKYGNADNLAVGRRVEVEGVRTASGTVIAREIEFEYD